jgi:hypothetical protein
MQSKITSANNTRVRPRAIIIFGLLIAVSVWGAAQYSRAQAATAGLASQVMLPLVQTGGTGDLCYEEVNGFVIGEIEDAPATDDWVFETDVPGYSGSGYYTWDRGAGLDPVGGRGRLVYKFHINQAGTYHFRLGNFHDHPDSTEENDVYVRIDGDSAQWRNRYFGAEWVKSFSPVAFKWNYSTWFEWFQVPDDHSTTKYQDGDNTFFFDEGMHILELSGRSHGYSIDRFVFFLDGLTFTEDPLIPPSPRCSAQ